MAIDAAMQMLHLTAAGGKKAYDLGRAVSNIADSEECLKVDVLNKLWESSKNYLEQNKGRKISTPEEIIPSDVEVLIEEAKKKEREIPKTPIEIDITPKEESFTTAKGSTYQVKIQMDQRHEQKLLVQNILAMKGYSLRAKKHIILRLSKQINSVKFRPAGQRVESMNFLMAP